jgi:hypothetical protein
MKLTYTTSLACASLLFACAIANAQTPQNAQTPADTSASSATKGQTQMASPGSDNTKGNNLDTSSKSPRVTTSSAPPSAGQDKSHGNDMVDANGTQKDSAMTDSGSMKQANAARPDFSTLDTKKTGKLTAADVHSNQWLSKNFSKCDTDHDGTLSRDEYEACH